jgi:N-acetylglucosamine-6-phosphate deacetylase
MSFKKGPVVTPQLIDILVAGIDYHLVEGTTTMYCSLKLKNGFTVTGTAACLPTTVFDPKVGMMWSRKAAEDKLTELLAFMVCDAINDGVALAAVNVSLNVLKEN